MILDRLDRRLLYELERDSSKPVSVLAKRLKRSKEVVSFRIRRLEREGILLGCSAIVDMAKLGYFTFRVYFRWQNVTEEEKRKAYDEIKVQKNVWTTTVLHGKWDFAFFVGVKTEHYIESFHKVWHGLMLKYKEKIAESKIAIYAPVHNFNKRFFIDFDMKMETIERIYGAGPPVEHDELDEWIVEAYASDVRLPLTKVAERVGVSAETVRQRIRKLEEKGVIVGYKINLDLPKLGYQGYRVDFLLNSVARNTELFEYLKRHTYFYQINRSIGGQDFETEIVVESLAHLLEILEEVVCRFHDVIRAYEYFGYSEFPTLSMVPD